MWIEYFQNFKNFQSNKGSKEFISPSQAKKQMKLQTSKNKCRLQNSVSFLLFLKFLMHGLYTSYGYDRYPCMYPRTDSVMTFCTVIKKVDETFSYYINLRLETTTSEEAGRPVQQTSPVGNQP